MTSTYYHFIQINDDGQAYLGYGDNRIVTVGQTVSVEGKPVLCRHGLHACKRILGTLQYAPDCRGALCEVTLSGIVISDDNKSVATERTIVRALTAEQTDKLLRDFARWCALQVAHLWEMPEVVRQYLETGDDNLRAAAWEAAREAAREAGGAAAWAAAWETQEDKLRQMFGEACGG